MSGIISSLFSSVSSNSKKDEEVIYKNELQQLRAEFADDVQVFAEKYPLVVSVYMCVSVIFGFCYLFSISPFNIINGLFHFGFGGAFWISAFKNHPLELGQRAVNSFKTLTAKAEVEKDVKE